MSGTWECGVCWAVYDPSEGDPVWQIEPGTPFEALPEHWRCPRCDTVKEKFLRKDDAPAAEVPLQDKVTAAYQAALPRMAGLPINNPRLGVFCSRFEPLPDGQLAVVMTPWCLNALWVPSQPGAQKAATVTRVLPSGAYDFVVGELEGLGEVWSLSLLSPVLEFDGPEAARLAVDAAFQALITRPAPEAPVAHSRRALFGLRSAAP